MGPHDPNMMCSVLSFRRSFQNAKEVKTKRKSRQVQHFQHGLFEAQESNFGLTHQLLAYYIIPFKLKHKTSIVIPFMGGSMRVA